MKASKAPADSEAMLTAVYEEIMWLARRPNTTASAARAWYTHIASMRLRRHLRIFSGQVSRRSLEPDAVLRLEHFKRLQTTLTKLVAEHVRKEAFDSREFVRVVKDCEQVHIVTAYENYEVMKASGDYCKAGISLVEWKDIALETRKSLWAKVLKGKVCNAQDFQPAQEDQPCQRAPKGRQSVR